MTVVATGTQTWDSLGVPPRPAVSRRLPGEAATSHRLPWAETAVFIAVLPLLSVPVMIATMGAAWAALGALALTGVAAWLCLARHAVVGHGWIADRRFFRYRITHARQLRAVDLVHTGHGGSLRLHPLRGRPHRLRAHEFEGAHVRTALAVIVTASEATVCAGATRALGLAERPREVVAGRST